MNSKISRAFL